ILFALSPAVSSLPALLVRCCPGGGRCPDSFQSFDAHESSQEEAEQGNQFLERLRPKSAAARRTQDPEAGDGLIHEQGLTDDRTIVIKPRAGRGEQVKTTFQKSLRITRGQWVSESETSKLLRQASAQTDAENGEAEDTSRVRSGFVPLPSDCGLLFGAARQVLSPPLSVSVDHSDINPCFNLL
ncbi:hypothetical protein TGCAST_390330, partial [Toxoplasma gondii CAST]